MSFMHFDATTAASADTEIVQLLNQDCSGVSIVASMTLLADGRMFCFDGTAPAWPWNWIDPLVAAPSNYEFRRINSFGDAPGFGPLDGVWETIGFGVFNAFPNPGGTGYAVNDTLTLTTGTFTEPATLNVDTLGGGNSVATVSVVNPGEYSIFPDGSAGSTTVEPSGGTGCLIGANMDLHFSWVYLIGGQSGGWDVQIRKGAGPVLKTASWTMSTS